ncbi:hypothetical protein EDB84DRAFT_1444902 [Lactarius hengduanensis]|nr:hypothetical protein EDB84DRAFT_1444902 [Lactarius hengduanensis]
MILHLRVTLSTSAGPTALAMWCSIRQHHFEWRHMQGCELRVDHLGNDEDITGASSTTQPDNTTGATTAAKAANCGDATIATHDKDTDDPTKAADMLCLGRDVHPTWREFLKWIGEGSGEIWSKPTVQIALGTEGYKKSSLGLLAANKPDLYSTTRDVQVIRR